MCASSLANSNIVIVIIVMLNTYIHRLHLYRMDICRQYSASCTVALSKIVSGQICLNSTIITTEKKQLCEATVLRKCFLLSRLLTWLSIDILWKTQFSPLSKNFSQTEKYFNSAMHIKHRLWNQNLQKTSYNTLLPLANFDRLYRLDTVCYELKTNNVYFLYTESPLIALL